jgi:hypothetical protein
MTNSHAQQAELTIRRSRPSDRAALERLAALDSRQLPAGDLLLGEVDGAALAAVRIDDGATVADPFSPTADLVALIRQQARRMSGATRSPRLRLRQA